MSEGVRAAEDQLQKLADERTSLLVGMVRQLQMLEKQKLQTVKCPLFFFLPLIEERALSL